MQRPLAKLCLVGLVMAGCGGAGEAGEAHQREAAAVGADADTETASRAVTVEQGRLLGEVVPVAGGEPLVAFVRVPFALPPVGNRRWRAPVPVDSVLGAYQHSSYPGNVAPLSTVYDARLSSTANTPESYFCLQAKVATTPIEVSGSEDCLYLNVWVRASVLDDPAVEQRNLPVLFWIHGGGLVAGSGADSTYRPQALLSRPDYNVVFVSINYRLGPLGFLAHPALRAEDPTSTGNLGSLDQIAALKWVQKNIRKFGGDPYNVTIFGESAGAGSTLTLYSSPLARPYFAKAIAQSGGFKRRSLAEGEAAGSSFISAFAGAGAAGPQQCAGQSGGALFACLRSLPGHAAGQPDDDITRMVAFGEGEGGMFAGYFNQNVDGYLLTAGDLGAYLKTAPAGKPLITGTNRNEATLFLPFVLRPALKAFIPAGKTEPENIPREAVLTLLDTLTGSAANTQKLLARPDLYGTFPSVYKEYRSLIDQADRIGTDLVKCENRRAALDAAAGASPGTVWRYELRDVLDWGAVLGGLLDLFKFELAGPVTRSELAAILEGCPHGLDIAFLFKPAPWALSQEEQHISDLWIRRWLHFATHGHPNPPGAPVWSSIPRQQYGWILDDPMLVISGNPQDGDWDWDDKTHVSHNTWGLHQKECDFWAAMASGGL